MRKIVSVLIAFSLLVSGLISVCTGSGAGDLPADVVKDAWYYQNVVDMLEKGIMQGVGDSCFDPEGDLTRAQVAMILYRLEKDTLPKAGEAASFRDVGKEDWFYETVLWASETQVIGGYEDQTFRPNQPASREEVVTMIVRCFRVSETDVADVDLGQFSDAEDIQNYALVPMKYAVKNGWILGGEKNNLSPNATMTRAQMAAFTDRVFFTNPVEPGTTEKPGVDEGETGENELPIH